jgi:hypothetical protein
MCRPYIQSWTRIETHVGVSRPLASRAYALGFALRTRTRKAYALPICTSTCKSARSDSHPRLSSVSNVHGQKLIFVRLGKAIRDGISMFRPDGNGCV